MAQKVIWTLKAQHDRKAILQYWRNRNKSAAYSVKLNQLFLDHILLISQHPNIGVLTTDPFVRVKIIKDYLLFYELINSEIYILTIWDSRKNP